MVLRAGDDVNVAENSAHAEFVLILEISSAAPFQNNCSYLVFPRRHKRRDIEFRLRMRHGGIADEFSVYEQIKTTVYSVENDIMLSAFFRDDVIRDVKPARVFLINFRRIERNGIKEIRILIVIESL